MRKATRVLFCATAVLAVILTRTPPVNAHETSPGMGSTDPGAEGVSKGEAPGHSHERCELHGGLVTMTQAHHFETVFAPDGVRIFMYSTEQNPLRMEDVSGTVTVRDTTGASREVKLVPDVPKKGEKTVYFCPMHDSKPQMAPGKCPNCGMTLILQVGLFAPVDLSKAQPGAVKAIVHITGLKGKEKEATFTETNLPDEDAAKGDTK